eukprot:gene24662-14837_t
MTIVDSPDSEDIGNNTFENDLDFDDGYHVDNAFKAISNDIFEDISGNGDYADDDDNDGVAAMSAEEDEIGDLVDEDSGTGARTSGGAAKYAMEEYEDDDDFIEPAANDESSSDHPRVAKEPDYGNTLDRMDREHMEDLIRQAQAAVKDLETLVLACAAILLS